MPDNQTPIMKFFAYEHLPEKLQAISKPFHGVAVWMDATLPHGAEKSAGLRKLLEAKDCAVRAALSSLMPLTPGPPDPPNSKPVPRRVG